MSTTIRTPSLTVTRNGTPLSDVVSARTQHGFNMRVAEATVVCRALPSGIMPWDEIEITVGASAGTAAVRFTGYFIAPESQLYPQEVTLQCRGKLARAEVYEAPNNIDMSRYSAFIAGYDVSYGSTDQTMVATILYLCRVIPGWGNGPYLGADIGGTGKTLGLVSKNRGFEYREGETGLSFIERLDAVCLGYRTYDTFDGTVVRTLITAVPTGAADWPTFTEGADIFRASYGKTIIEAKNKIIVNGFPGWENETEIRKVAQGGNQFLLNTDGSQYYQVEHISSAMIESELTGGTGLSCQEVAEWQLNELNRYSERITLTTPRDDLIAAGDIIAVYAPSRLALATTKFWVQSVDVERSRSGGFSQVLTCITGAPVTVASVGGPSFSAGYLAAVYGVTISEEAAAGVLAVGFVIPAVTATYVGTLSASVAPVVVGVAIPAVTATYVLALSAEVAPLVVGVTLPAVTATYVSLLSAEVTPVVVGVALPAVTATNP